MVREKKGSVKILELDSNNRDADRDSSDESDIDESSNSLRPFEILVMHSCPHTVALHAFFCLFPSLSTLAFVSFLVFPILPDQLQETLSYRKILSLPSVP